MLQWFLPKCFFFLFFCSFVVSLCLCEQRASVLKWYRVSADTLRSLRGFIGVIQVYQCLHCMTYICIPCTVLFHQSLFQVHNLFYISVFQHYTHANTFLKLSKQISNRSCFFYFLLIMTFENSLQLSTFTFSIFILNMSQVKGNIQLMCFYAS